MTLRNAGLRACSGATLLLALASCASWSSPDESHRCGPPDFPYREGWLGGDAAYSIAIDPRTTLWLFGDTFVASPSQPSQSAGSPNRQGARLVHNSIALSHCRESGEWAFDYVWGSNESGTPKAFLTPARPGTHWWWLFDGFVHLEKLYIGLLVVQPSEARGALNLPFRFAGVKLARIANFRAPPEQWRAEILPLSDNPQVFPTSSWVPFGDYLYLFAFLDLESGHSPRILTRLPLAALEGARPGEQLEYLSRAGDWRPGLDANDARRLMADDAAEMSVRFHPEIGRWLAVYNTPSVDTELIGGRDASSLSESVVLRSAHSLEGPWSKPQAIFRFPELGDDPGAGLDPNTFCYAAKEHPQLAREGQLLITYVCNLFTQDGEDPLAVLQRLMEKTQLYRPRAISIPLPEVR